MAKSKGTVCILGRQSPFFTKLEKNLRKNRFKVVSKHKSKAALQEVKKTKPHIVVIEDVLEDGSGWEVLEAIKHSRETKRLPVVFIGSEDSYKAETRAMVSGASAYVPKDGLVDEIAMQQVYSALLIASLQSKNTPNPDKASRR
jgi:DNA-binding response OmpR family regulator